MADLKPVPPRDRQRWADAGAVDQGDRRPLRECAACGGFVAFVQSSRTGKWYLADCFRYRGGDRFYYVKASPHFKTCERVLADRAAEEARERDKADEDARFAVCLAAIREMAAGFESSHGAGYGSLPEYETALNALFVEHGFEHLAVYGSLRDHGSAGES